MFNKNFMISFRLWQFWFGWAGEFQGKRGFFFTTLTFSREIGIEIRFPDAELKEGIH